MSLDRKTHTRQYMREYMKNVRESETLEQKQIRMENNRESAKKWYRENKDKKSLYVKDWRVVNGRSEVRNKKKCELCGLDILQVLDSHHIIPRALGGSDKQENKITLCANCHRMIHAGILTLSSPPF